MDLLITALLEEEKQRIDSITAGWDDPASFDWDNEEKSEALGADETSEVPSTIPIYKCTALYYYSVRFY